MSYESVALIGFTGLYLTPWDNMDWIVWGVVMLFGMFGTLAKTISPTVNTTIYTMCPEKYVNRVIEMMKNKKDD